MKSGIYRVVNRVNGKCYVDSSNNCTRRRSDHFKLLRENNHHSIYLQRAYNKYGEDMFSFEFLEEVKNENHLIPYEQSYLDYYWKQGCYNMTPIAGKPPSPRGRKYSEEARQKMSESRKGRKHTKEARQKMSKAQRGRKVSEKTRKKLSKVNSGKRNKFFGKKHTAETRRKMSEGQNNKPVVRTDPRTGEEKLYESATKAKLDGFHQGTISACCLGKRKTHKGFRWQFVQDANAKGKQ